MKQTAVEQLSQILKETGYDVISEYGFQLLNDNQIVVTQKQARVMAQLIKDISTTSYATGYSQGKADQAYEDGFKAGKDQQ
ncbi:hypothetical protein EFS28_09760 [Lactobacillus acidophilus]|uniref:hypothetical protein n=1 Tax=Lactobacillus acidophilus TaxID=1579 RepID=UPI0021A32B8C|nr:hypothetical protein [Lactobacillus acidophilus]MCT3602237.1 hypothetical protein [Lactobacillus acidophilus]MCT3624476.1 hypothetical protein [Lactobacillus acidophilus]